MFRLSRFIPKPWRRRLRRAVRHSMRVGSVLLALVGFAIACFGVPMARPSEKDLSKPFPCANRPCGCMSADSCWKACCCFTHEQKLAWAAENGVTVPAFALQQKPAPTKAKSTVHVVGCSHCKAKVVPEKACCAKSAKPAKTKWVIGMMARKCRGQGSDWLSAGAVLPAPPNVLAMHDGTSTERFIPGDVSPPSVLPTPPIPPPRLLTGLLG